MAADATENSFNDNKAFVVFYSNFLECCDTSILGYFFLSAIVDVSADDTAENFFQVKWFWVRFRSM